MPGLSGPMTLATAVEIRKSQSQKGPVMRMTKTTADTELIAKAVELACRAPSLHNSQPWRWVVTGTGVDLFADPHRVVRSSDSAGREAIIGCGAALDHFRVAMAASGWNTTVEMFPNSNKLDHL